VYRPESGIEQEEEEADETLLEEVHRPESGIEQEEEEADETSGLKAVLQKCLRFLCSCK